MSLFTANEVVRFVGLKLLSMALAMRGLVMIDAAAGDIATPEGEELVDCVGVGTSVAVAAVVAVFAWLLFFDT